MEKRTVLAVVLSFALIVLWQLLIVQPKMEKQKELARKKMVEQAARAAKMKENEETQETGIALKKAQEKKESIVSESGVVPPAIKADTAYKVMVKTKYYEAEITNAGARISSWKLLDYTNEQEDKLNLVNRKMKNRGYMPLGLFSRQKPDLAAQINEARFKTNANPGAVINLTKGVQKEYKLLLEYSDGKKNAVKKTLTFRADSYLVTLDLEVAGEILETSYITLGPGLENFEEINGSSFLVPSGPQYQTVLGHLQGEVERTDKVKEDKLLPWDGIKYLGIETMYFAALFSTPDVRSSASANGEARAAIVFPLKDAAFDEVQKAQAIAVGLKLENNMKTDLFLGPKEYELSQSLGFEGLVDFGFWQFFALPLLKVLKLVYGYSGNYGIAILVLTLLINIVFYPLRQKSFRSMEKMREIQPKVNAIKSKYEKFKKDMQKRQEMNQEVMALYKTENVSPTGGCLPLLLQFPVLIAMYRMLGTAIEIRHAPFMLWISDLSIKDPYYITPLVMGLTMWLQNKFSPQAGGADATTSKMFKIMPIFFTLLFLNMPAGLVLYWLFNNVLSIGQQYLLRQKLAKQKAMLKQSKSKRRNK